MREAHGSEQLGLLPAGPGAIAGAPVPRRDLWVGQGGVGGWRGRGMVWGGGWGREGGDGGDGFEKRGGIEEMLV